MAKCQGSSLTASIETGGHTSFLWLGKSYTYPGRYIHIKIWITYISFRKTRHPLEKLDFLVKTEAVESCKKEIREAVSGTNCSVKISEPEKPRQRK